MVLQAYRPMAARQANRRPLLTTRRGSAPHNRARSGGIVAPRGAKGASGGEARGNLAALGLWLGRIRAQRPDHRDRRACALAANRPHDATLLVARSHAGIRASAALVGMASGWAVLHDGCLGVRYGCVQSTAARSVFGTLGRVP